MVQRIGSSRRKTRNKFKKGVREKGKISITRYFQKLESGDKVILNAEPAVQRGLYHPRFHGKMVTVKGLKGRSYVVELKDRTVVKELIVHPVHLKRV